MALKVDYTEVQVDCLLIVPQEEEWIHEQLGEWGRWCRNRGERPARVYSLEGNYRPPRGSEAEWETTITPVAALPAPYDPMCLNIEKIVSTMPDGPAGVHRYRTALRLFYVRRADRKWLRSELSIHFAQVPIVLSRARCVVRNRLRLFAGGGTIRADDR